MALNSAQYKNVFDLHYEALYRYACSILKEETYVEDILQNIFIKLWQGRNSIKPDTAKAYLYTSVRNECLNHLKHKGVQSKYIKAKLAVSVDWDHPIDAERNELQRKIHQLTNQLPEKCAEVFYMSRQLGLSYREVAETMGISVKTVENQISKALKFLRNGLAEYLVNLVFVFIIQLVNLLYGA